MVSAEALFQDISKGNTGALAKGITLMESQLEAHQKEANTLLDLCLPKSGNSIRIAVTGVPGVGKSTFIDAFGTYLINHFNKRVAVLAIDPTSQQTRGSILGDKTRMQRLSTSDKAFVRPSPSGSTLGGVAAQTRESILLCEAAGFDVIFVETVGVGQSETLVHSMVDFFLLLLLPGAGDELQGIKRGIVEMADAIAINKSQTNAKLAKEAKNHYRNALQLLHPNRKDWKIEVEQIDSITETNLDGLWSIITRFVQEQSDNGELLLNRKRQAQKWFTEQLGSMLNQRFDRDKKLRVKREELLTQVGEEQISPRQAASLLIDFALGE